MKAKYDVEYFMQSSRFWETIRERYGVDHPLRLQAFLDKRDQTCLERYGAKNVAQSAYFANLPYAHGCHKTGYVSFRGDMVWCRSSYEQRFVGWCDRNSDVVGLTCNIPISYEFEGVQRTYFIDYALVLSDEERRLCEVKSEWAKSFSKNVAKFAAAQAQYCALGYASFDVVTEATLADCP
jgi:hypothetical protein